MIIKNASFITSAASPKDMIVSDTMQIAVVGKSNVGKSSFINMMTNDGKLARVSKEPGRTRLINYFLINGGDFILTDLPGYGFAKVGDDEKIRWAKLIDGYLDNEEALAHVFFLVDIRHEPTTDDLVMYDYLFRKGLPFTVLATKSDKLSKVRIADSRRKIAATFKLGIGNVIPVSSQTRAGKEDVLETIQRVFDAYHTPLTEEE